MTPRDSPRLAVGAPAGRATAVAAFGALVMLFSGCGREVSSPVLNPRPTHLRLGYTPSEDAVADREAATLALARYLERQLGITFTVVRTARTI